MISKTYRLISPKQIRVDLVDEKLKENEVVVRPSYLSICAADERYYTGSRGEAVMKKKLPMALIHESVGEIILDPSGEYEVGTKVVMIPNTPREKDEVIRENYLRSSVFKSSGYDGFMRDIVVMEKSRIIPYNNVEDRVAVLLELISVSINALDNFKKHAHKRRNQIGVWGDGSVGFVTALILKYNLPDSKVYLFGHVPEKMQYFQFCDGVYSSNEIPEDLKIDHAFECVGGVHSGTAINQIIDIINPQGTISILGVSENNVPLNTRMILEKGLSILGNSRSGYQDFYDGIKFLENNPKAHEYLKNIISDELVVKSLDDVHHAFDADLSNDFKTIMKWEI